MDQPAQENTPAPDEDDTRPEAGQAAHETEDLPVWEGNPFRKVEELRHLHPELWKDELFQRARRSFHFKPPVPQEKDPPHVPRLKRPDEEKGGG